MQITRLVVENFRSIRKIELDLGQTTVLIGPNNAGKTAVLDALRIALTRRWGKSGTGFTEYDIHLQDENADPKTSPGLAIEIRVEEAVAGEWPATVQQELDDISQTDPITGRTHITLRLTFAWDSTKDEFVQSWSFLNAARAPLLGGSARRMNLERFWQYLPVFYLAALRDASDEFSARSQFWGRLLKTIQIPQALEQRVERVLGVLNSRLLNADPKLRRIASTLSGATTIAAQDRAGAADLQLLPLKSWDLLSKAEIILQNDASWPWLPLRRHGQGVQSLSVLFLFQSFVEHLLTEVFEPESTPVLALEEPETHLHPQAARSLWRHVSSLSGQKVITTHSPYFVQHVPFRDLRLLRLTAAGTEIRWLPTEFTAVIPHVPALDTEVRNSRGALRYERATETLTVKGKLEDQRYRDLLTCYGGTPERVRAEPALRDLKDRSAVYVSDDDLRALDTFARRIRGEIFFANKWMFVEGQAEYLLVQSLAKAMGYDFDGHGIALVDAVNNGNPQIFATIARALAIPWLGVFDGDLAGQGYVTGIQNRGFDAAFVSARCRLLPAGTLEQQLVADGLEPDLRQLLHSAGHAQSLTCTPADFLRLLEKTKTEYAALLGVAIERGQIAANRMPASFRDAINDLRTLA